MSSEFCLSVSIVKFSPICPNLEIIVTIIPTSTLGKEESSRLHSVYRFLGQWHNMDMHSFAVCNRLPIISWAAEDEDTFTCTIRDDDDDVTWGQLKEERIFEEEKEEDEEFEKELPAVPISMHSYIVFPISATKSEGWPLISPTALSMSSFLGNELDASDTHLLIESICMFCNALPSFSRMDTYIYIHVYFSLLTYE